MAEKQAVQEALRESILKLAKDGDEKKGGELTPDVLQRIMRVAKTGRDLMVSLSASPANLSGMVRRPRLGPMAIPAYGDNLDDDLGDGNVSLGGVSSYAPALPAENFGMTAIRELISAAKNLNGNGSSPVKLVEALAIAREKGLDDVAHKLEEELGVRKAQPPTPAVAVPASVGDEKKGDTQS